MFVCRNKERGEAALSQIQTKTGNQNVHLEICDLSSVADIKSLASRFSKKNAPLHVLVNNAGLIKPNRVTTSEGNFNGTEQYARNNRVQVALTENWGETYKNKGIGFYSMHPGWAETSGVAKSLPNFSNS
ncbi:hypothetical protein P8452_50864 [Trifolium repens]|nr:hypothetical protein P8452_50864 [Trifolium repens]